MAKVNWDKASESMLVTDGDYLCRVFDISIKYTKNGNEMWNIKMIIETEGEFYGKHLFHNLVFGDSSLWMVKLFYEAALGKELNGEYECSVDDLMDKYLIVTVKGKKKYKEKDQPILAYFKSVDKKVKKAVVDDDEMIPF